MPEQYQSPYPLYEANKAAFRAIPEKLINTGAFADAGRYIAAEYIEHALPAEANGPGGLAGFKTYFSELRAAFPDLHYTIEEPLLAEGDKVVGRVTVRGTMQGPFLGMAATGKTATWSEVHVGRIADGKLVEHWATIDQLGMLHQPGLMPPPEK